MSQEITLVSQVLHLPLWLWLWGAVAVFWFLYLIGSELRTYLRRRRDNRRGILVRLRRRRPSPLQRRRSIAIVSPSRL